MKLIAFESSCDETSAAVLVNGVIRSNIVASQVDLHAIYGGVVPELAVREHLRQLPLVGRRALEVAGLGAGELDAVAATRGPGLPGALLMGLKAGQGMAAALKIPFIGVHHHEAHLYSPWIQGDPPQAQWESFLPNVSLIVSGGHTLLVDVPQPLHHQLLGGTVDDAAGECFDKVAKLIGLPYPGGPVLDQLAAEGDPSGLNFPRPKLKDPDDDFSFSGLKTSVRYHLRDHPELLENGQGIRDLCAAVQAAIVEVLVTKSIRAARRLHRPCITASGGVTCNRGLRSALATACSRENIELRLAAPSWCTDNAGMVGVIAERRLTAGKQGSLDDEPKPGWELG
ncbi:MAG: tRNA (N6-threonylcarbamyl-A37) modification enzyme [Verrucomicrobiota bacterium]